MLALTDVIQCTDRVLPLQAPEIGALSLHLPCGCSLLVDSERMDSDSFPCILPGLQPATINHTLPAIFATKYRKVKISALKPIPLPIESNISSILDPEVDLNKAEEFRNKIEAKQNDFETPLPIWINDSFDSSHSNLCLVNANNNIDLLSLHILSPNTGTCNKNPIGFSYTCSSLKKIIRVADL